MTRKTNMFKKIKNLFTLTKRVEKLEEQEHKECKHILIYRIMENGYCVVCTKMFINIFKN